RVYFTTTEETYCIGKPGLKAVKNVNPPQTRRQPNPNAQPAHLLVYPADVVLEPGQGAAFTVRAYDANGDFIKEIKADEWLLPAPPPPPGATGSPPPLQGAITPEGKLTAAKAPPGQFGTVLAKAGNLSARARVRVVPPLPIKQDFANVP